MTNSMYIQGGTLYHADGSEIKHPLIEIRDGKVVSVTTAIEAPSDADVFHVADDDVILPGMIDLHIHGSYGADVMDGTNEALAMMSRTLPKEGVTAYLATTITDEEQTIEQALKNVAGYYHDRGAELLGVHLEGPFISPLQAGAQPKEAIRQPDAATFRRWQQLADGYIRLVTFAPEEEGGLELLDAMTDLGVISSIGHSHATYDVIQEAEKRGLTHATHLFNGMRPLHHREPGVVGSIYLSKQLKAELIFDGVHVSPEVARLSWQILGSDRLMLITDAMRGKGLGDGDFELGGQPVAIRNREARLSDGTLAGSVLTMDQAVRHALKLPGIQWTDIVKVTSYNQAKSLKIDDRKGALKPGYDADIVVMTQDGTVKNTWCKGVERQ
ncbi:N-acetylglucosamine-6-phosphate deacetylase [Salisediminibacterium beveridgei]|nr:N-acetylglucosamine-6-phosphate deacetylase [Salisediminibacterium beveridgei]